MVPHYPCCVDTLLSAHTASPCACRLTLPQPSLSTSCSCSEAAFTYSSCLQLPARQKCNSLVHDTVTGQPQHDLIQCRVGRGANQHVGPLIALGSHRLQWGLVQQPIGVHPGGLICAVPGLDQVPAACTAALESLFTAQLGLVHNA